jgi:hypothetical protein
MVGEIFKAFANLFDPTTVGKETGSAIDKMFADFKKGFDSVDGSKWMKMVVDGLNDIIMRLLFNEGNIMKGVTPLGEGLAKIFLLLSAPAFISALISGLVPVALFSMGGMIKAVFKGIAKGAQFTTQKARGPVKNWWQTAYTKPIGPAQAGSYEAMRGPGSIASKLTGTAKIQGALSSLVKIGQKIPGLSLALAGLDFTLRKASGQKTSVAAGGAAGSLVGGIAGGALGSALGPVGTVAGAVGGSIIGSWIGENLIPAVQALPGMLSSAWSGFVNWVTNLPYN